MLLRGREVHVGFKVPTSGFSVINVAPAPGPVLVTRNTRITLQQQVTASKDPSALQQSPESALAAKMGGMERTRDMLLEVVLLPILLSDLFTTMGIAPPRGTAPHVAPTPSDSI